MPGVRRALLLFGLACLVGGASQVAPGPTTVPWERLEQHVRQTLAMGGALPAVRVDLGQSYALLKRAAVGGSL